MDIKTYIAEKLVKKNKEHLSLPWLEFNKNVFWYEAYPCPPYFRPTYINHISLGGDPFIDEAVQKQFYQFWQSSASISYNLLKERTDEQLNKLQQLMGKYLEKIRTLYGELVTRSEALQEWVDNNSLLNLEEFLAIEITYDYIRNFLIPLIKRQQGKYQLPDLSPFVSRLKQPNELNNYIEILRDVSAKKGKPIINDQGMWISGYGSKSIAIAWAKVLTQRSKFTIHIDDKAMAELLNGLFPGLNLDIKDASLFRKDTSIGNKYHADFLQRIR